MKLISCTERNISSGLNTIDNGYSFREYFGKTYNYAKFLSMKLELWMFVACDSDGNVLEEPNHLDYKQKNQFNELVFISDYHKNRYCDEYELYQQAQQRIIFEGFEVKTKTAFNNGYQFVCDSNEIFYPFWYNPVTGWELSKGLKTIEDLIIFQPTITPNAIETYKLK